MSSGYPNIPPLSLRAISAGATLKHTHIPDVLDGRAPADFFEVNAEDYMGNGGPPHQLLLRLRQRYPIAMCGTGLSLGADQPLDRAHLARLRNLIDRYQPSHFSAHLAWSHYDGLYFNDPLPLPYNDETLGRVCGHVESAQRALGMQILLENPPAYVTLAASTLRETEFLRAVIARTDCGLLLDIASVYASAINQDFEPMDYIDSYPVEHVREIHLAGFSEHTDDDGGRLLVDDHRGAVPPVIWALFRRALARIGPTPTVIEWDNKFPISPDVEADVTRAKDALQFESQRRTRQLAQ
jgi:uncharacterized protein